MLQSIINLLELMKKAWDVINFLESFGRSKKILSEQRIINFNIFLENFKKTCKDDKGKV